MSRMLLLEGLLQNLKGAIKEGRREYVPRKEAYRLLKLHTGKDFGDDLASWEEWVALHPESVVHLGRTKEEKEFISSRVEKLLRWAGVDRDGKPAKDDPAQE